MRGDESSKARAHRARGSSSAAELVLDEQVSRQVDRQLRQVFGDPARLREKVEVLTGERGKGKAATIEQLRAMLASVPAMPTSREVAAAPTREEHNALVQDVAKLYAAINALRVLLQ